MKTDLARDILRMACITALVIVGVVLNGCRSAADSRPRVEIHGSDNAVSVQISTKGVESAQGKTVSPNVANEEGDGDGGVTIPLVP